MLLSYSSRGTTSRWVAVSDNMHNMVKSYNHTIHFVLKALLLVAPVFLLCCCRKDSGEPRSRLRLHLSFTFHGEDKDLFDDVANTGDIFIYRSDGSLLEHRAMTESERDAAVLDLSVPSGDTYTVVFWGNLDRENYVLNGEHSLSTHRVDLLGSSGEFGYILSDLLHGVFVFPASSGVPVSDYDVSLRSLTNQVNVFLEGAMNWTRAEGTPFEVMISGTGSSYGWDAASLPGKSLTYRAVYTPDFPGYDHALAATFHTLHMTPSDDFRLIVFNGPDIIYNEPLVPLLMQNPDIQTEEDLWRHSFWFLCFDSNMDLSNNYAKSSGLQAMPSALYR